MALTEAKKRANAKYIAKTLKRVPLDVRKEDYEVIKRIADHLGESVNGFIKQAIKERLARVQKEETKLDELNFSMNEE